MTAQFKSILLSCVIIVVGQTQTETENYSVNDPYKKECSSRNILCHSKAICRLDLVTETFYCQCLPGYNGDGIHFCQEPTASIAVDSQEDCDGVGQQVCLLKRAVGGNTTFTVSISGDFQYSQITWYKFYASQGHTFHSYRQRLTLSGGLPTTSHILRNGLALTLGKIKEDDFFPNKFWVQLEESEPSENKQEVEPYDFTHFEMLNPTRLQYYFVLDSEPIDVGKFLLGEMSVIQLNPYYTDVSETGFVKWVKEPDNLTLIQTTSTVLANRTSAIEIDGLLNEDFGNIRAIVYDFLPGIPGKVMIAQRLFNLRKDISKVCKGSQNAKNCACNTGFKGNGIHCIDQDECIEGMPLHCLPDAKCINTYGSYVCQCPNGYEGDGLYSCMDIDECMRDLHQCSPRAACINTLGSYVCTCQFGFFQEGNECRATSIWTPWSPWSLCSVTCGSQNQMRIRICTNPESGMRCEGPTSDLKPCSSLQACPVDGLWSEWSPLVNLHCQLLWNQEKNRVCNNPAPSSGGQSCLGSPEEIAPCNNDNCPVNGMWSPWAPWTLCPLTCGLGVVSRSRHCNNPPPVSGGTPCPGHGYEEGSCGFPMDYCKVSWDALRSHTQDCNIPVIYREQTPVQ
ncbi:fibrillin-1-like [Huso huso]|uniref:Fibrillin-1-like n=1 Tax=Huso huso TaxID=61971 RepID=A0ABR0YZD3_HUSHU